MDKKTPSKSAGKSAPGGKGKPAASKGGPTGMAASKGKVAPKGKK
tara:strand:+ start:576 stop:710 length:135 start_codon:yes stop_codon:yes gene_type:complete